MKESTYQAWLNKDREWIGDYCSRTRKPLYKGRAPDPAAHRPCVRRHGASEWRRCVGAGNGGRCGGLLFGLIVCGIYLAIRSVDLDPRPVYAEAGAERPGAFPE